MKARKPKTDKSKLLTSILIQENYDSQPDFNSKKLRQSTCAEDVERVRQIFPKNHPWNVHLICIIFSS